MSERSLTPSSVLERTLVQTPQNLEAQQILARVGAELFGDDAPATGRYEILGKLGAGGMGVVYEAHDPLLDCAVALKQLHVHLLAEPGFLERLRAEARAMAKLRAEPHVVTLYDFFVQGEVVFVVMELVRGTTLRAWQHEPRRIDEVLAIYEQAGRGLVAAHRAGLVHRDFKPENVLIERGGVAKVSDFGLARDARGRRSTSPELAEDVTLPGMSGPSAVLTRPGGVVGTPRYMAPEQMHGDPAEPRSDQFSFCVALWEALFDEHPFFPLAAEPLVRESADSSVVLGPVPEPGVTAAPSPFAYMHAILEGPLRPVPASSAVPARVVAALTRGLAKEPHLRFPKLEDLLAALRPAPPRRRVTPLLAAGAVLGAALWGMTPASEAPPPTREALTASALADITAELEPGALPTVLPAGVAQELSRYALRWAEQHAGQTFALQRRPGDPEATTRLRCLVDARRSAKVVAEGLRRASAASPRALELVEELPAPEECVTMAMDWLACSQGLSAIGSEAAAAPVFAEMDAAGRLEAAGDFPAALGHAAAAVAGAESLGLPLLRGQAGYLHGRLLYLSGRGEEAVTALLRARDAVEPTGCLDLRSNVYSRLIKTTAMYPGTPATVAEEWSRVHMILAEATPDGGARLADAYNERGLLRLLRRGDPRGALADFRRSIELREHVLGGRPSSELADSYLNIGLARRQLGDLDGAEQALDESTRVRAAIHGADHPLHYRELKERAEVLIDRKDLAGAERLLRSALAAIETGLGRNTIPAARVLLSLAHVREVAEDHAQARAIAEDAERRVASGDLDPSERLEVRVNAALMRGGPDVAGELRALGREASDEPRVGLDTRALLAAVQAEHAYDVDDPAAAVRHAEQALTLLAQAGLGPESELSARIRRIRGLAALSLGDLDVAIALLAGLVAAESSAAGSEEDREGIELALASAHVNRDGPGDRERGCARLRDLLARSRSLSQDPELRVLMKSCRIE